MIERYRTALFELGPAHDNAGFLARTLLLAKLGQTFSLSSTDVWVQPVALALTVE